MAAISAALPMQPKSLRFRCVSFVYNITLYYGRQVWWVGLNQKEIARAVVIIVQNSKQIVETFTAAAHLVCD